MINVEPSGELIGYNDDNWKLYNDISLVDEKIDFIYGSHSLEHVQDIRVQEEHIERLLKRKGFLFYEVPNCVIESNGGINGKLRPPHTYYFTLEYFKSFDLFEPLVCNTFNIKTFPNACSQDGEVIRYFGKKR